ncbi:hypothetical protein C8J57DRAFT_1705548 [Mycena rebaudengoi]|nr:hypothetical protein C8J57DRAFT_1705548 [Mycena rebaudengoi]
MQLTLVALFAVAATGVTAVPTHPVFSRQGSCDIIGCVSALAPTVVSCGTAAVSLGADIVADGGCLIDAAKIAINLPDSCSGCAEQLGVADAVNQAAAAVEETAGDAGDAIGGVVDQAKDTIAGIFGKLFGREY